MDKIQIFRSRIPNLKQEGLPIVPRVKIQNFPKGKNVPRVWDWDRFVKITCLARTQIAIKCRNFYRIQFGLIKINKMH